MKKYIASFMVACLLLMCSSAWADYWNEGHSGTEADPYVIDTNADLVALRDRVNAGTESADKYYKLTENLNISQTTGWVSIGNSEQRAFTGHFDGNGKSIHVNIVRYYDSNVALFRFVDTALGTYAVKNLTVSGTVRGNYAAGIITNLRSGNVENCSFTGTVAGHYNCEYAGGIAAIMSGGKISQCNVTGTIQRASYMGSTSHLGGIVAYMTGGSVENCKVEGVEIFNKENADTVYIGGIVGYADIANFDTIKDCKFSGTVNATNGKSYAGGIIGYLKGGNLQNNHVTADANASSSVSGAGYAGGIVARIGEATVVESCDVSSLVTVSGGSQAIGGIVALMNASTVRNNQSYASIEGDIVNMGGAVGKLDAASYTISNNRYSSAEHGIGNNAQGAPSEEGCIKVGASIAITIASPLPDAVVKSAYTTTLATDSTTAVVWNLTNGTSLPAGLELGRSTGQISGTPTTEGEFTFTVKASPTTGAPATKEFKLTVQAEGTLAITTTDLPSGTTGTAYSSTLVSNPTGATWSIASGTLPAGLSLSSAGTISGTPTTAGTSRFTVRATLGERRAEKQLSITITGTTPPTPTVITITTTSLPAGTRGASYSAVLAANSSSVTWSIASGSLPAGLTLSNSGTISGTPTAAGTSRFTVRATSGSNSATKELSITISEGSTPTPTTITITTTSLPAGTRGASYSAVLAANSSSVTWSIASGSLPAGLTLSNSGTISGTPTVAGTSRFTVRATSGSNSATKELSITISEGSTPTPTTIEITTTTIPTGVAGMPYNASLASNPSGATWTLSGNLPAGLVMDSSGRISGTPTVSGRFPFTVTASYGTVSAVRSLTLTIDALEITTTSLPSGRVGGSYNQTLRTNGSGLSWRVSAGSLPAGLTLGETNGVLSGTLTESGEYTFTVYAYNSFASASRQFTVRVDGGDSDSGSSGGGCNSALGIMALAVLGFALKKK